MNVAEYVLKALREQGVTHAFVDLGGLNDAFMGPLTSTDGLRTIVAAFEGGAAYMADGYARASGRLGVCFGIGGPGILNMTTALAAASADRSGILAISGEVPRSWEGIGGFQDASGAAIDDIDALKTVTTVSLSVSSASLVPHHLRHAITAALAERRPAHLSLPVDVQKTEIDATWVPVPSEVVAPKVLDEPAFACLLDLLADSARSSNIVLLVGPGVVQTGAEADLVAFAERFDIPIATTLSGKGAVSEDHPLALGVFGYGGSQWAIDAILDDDVEVLLVIGSGLSQRDTMQWDPKMLPSTAFVHVERDPLTLGRTWPSEVAVVGEPATVLKRLRAVDGAVAAALESGAGIRRAFLTEVQARKERLYSEDDTRSEAVPMHPARVVTELRAAMPDDGVLCVDSGAHRAWFAEYWSVRTPGAHMSLTNLGPMGGAIPLGIGAKLARPGQPLMVATGDGCMLMHGMEVHTAARFEVPMIIAVMNNRSYGNIWYRAHQIGPRAARLTDIPGIDWVSFARSMGGDGESIEHPGDIASAVQRGLSATGPYLLDLHVDKTFPTPVSAWRERQAEWQDDD